MSLQYVADSKGRTTGVFIPINDWNKLTKKFKGLEGDETELALVPEWHKKIVRKRLQDYKENPQSSLNWDDVQKEIEKKYGF